MKFRFSALWLKILAFLLATVCLALGVVSAYATLVCMELGIYKGATSFLSTWRCYSKVSDLIDQVSDRYASKPDYDHWASYLHNMNADNLRFILLREDTGEILASYLDGLDLQLPENLKDNDFLYTYDYPMKLQTEGLFQGLYVTDRYPEPEWMAVLLEQATGEPVTDPQPTYQVLCLLPEELTARDWFWENQQSFALLERYRITAPVTLGVCVLLLLGCLVFLCCQAGRRPGREAVKAGWVERIPLDLLLVAAIAAGLCFLAAVFEMVDVELSTGMWQAKLVGLTVICSFCGMVILGFFCTFATRVKLGKWWENSVIFRLLRWCWRRLTTLRKWLKRARIIAAGGLHGIGLVPKAALVICLAVLIDWVLTGLFYQALHHYGSTGFWLLLAVLFNLFLLAAAIYAVVQMKQLQDGAARLAAGDLDYQLDTSKMYWEFKRHGDNLNAIAGGMNKAVEQRMKSERLKTELITNVSHDIKTPLTSIVNYVDLLQKPHTEAEGIQYLEVLDRQARRLKRLTENLVEASKASTGNLPVDLAPTSVTELMNQAAAEYRERLAAGKLDLVLSLEENLTVLADGKLLWRIMDNLLNNVVKYALAGTRVYLTAQKKDDWVIIAVKNISRDSLNVDADELMERFVRGDASRTTEGSGLGLNIARSLTQLQKGDFRLTVDGDLFKAEIVLPVQ